VTTRCIPALAVIGFCLIFGTARSASWMTTLDRAESLIGRGNPDSAEVLIEQALSEALNEYDLSDTTVELRISEGGITRRHYFTGYAEAETLYTRIIALRERTAGREHPGYARSLADLARLYHQQERYAEAESLQTEALAIRLASLGAQDLEVAQSLMSLAGASQVRGEFAEAESLYRQALAIREAKLGSDHLEVAQSLAGLGAAVVGLGRHAESESLCTRALAIRETSLGPDHLEVAESLNGLARSFARQGRLAEAGSLFTMSVAIKKDHLGPRHSDVANGLRNLAIIKERQAKYAEAESLYLSALDIWNQVYGTEHTLIADCLHSLGTTYVIWGKSAEAESLYLSAVEMRGKILGHDHWKVAETLNNLGILYKNQGRYAEAEKLHRRALAIREKAFGPEHIDVAGSANNLAVVYWRYGRYDEAEMYFKRSLAIKEKMLGPEHPNVKSSLDNLGRMYVVLGRYAEAEPLLKRALAIGEKTMGPDHPRVANTLSNLGGLYLNQGRYDECEAVQSRSLAIREKTLGPESAEVASVYINLGLAYLRQKRYAEAESLHIRALALNEKVLGPDHPDLALNLNNLGVIYRRLGRYAQAESLHERSVAIWERAYGPEHPAVADGLDDLATAAIDRGAYDRAETLLTRVLTIREEALGPRHNRTASGWETTCRLYRLQERKTEALDVAARAMQIRSENFASNAFVLSERDALTYSRQLRKSLGAYLATYFESGPAESKTAANVADIVLCTKGQVSDGVFERRRTLVEESDSATIALAEDLRFAKFQLSSLVVAGPDEDLESYKSRVDSLGRLANELETKLSRQSLSFRKHQDRKNISATRISSLLPQGAALVEYVRYDYLEAEHERTVPHYLAIVLDESAAPSIIDLGEAAEIDALVEDYRSHMAAIASSGRPPTVVDQQDYDELCDRIGGRIWEPVAGHLRDTDKVFIAPDGALSMVSFAGLRSSQGEYLAEAFTIHHLSSGRDLIRLEQEPGQAAGLFALGDPDYGAVVSDRLAAMQPEEQSPIEVAFVTRNVRSGCRELSESEVTPLPGTRREIESIMESWLEATDEPATICLGHEASEEYFKSEAPGKRVIHLATHGYFLGGACRAEDAGMDFVGENPLLLSGLFLAGANLHGEGADTLGAEDGILTAYEVSSMDLEGTELVVLSACETGIGEVEEGEGIYGLRRAFQVAGARTVVSALWPVSDEATAEMMGGLYERKDEALPETIRRMQLEKLDQLRKMGEIDHPFTWGAFIALGDWR
jgi:tetratricopeptide (TPR) repeat protein/CHAT domain-containing protein